MSKIEVEAATNDKGEVRVGFRLTKEHQAALVALHSSPHWKVYRELLIAAKSEFFNGVLPMNDPHAVMKQVGQVAGLNFAINQLPVLVAEFNRQRDKELAKREKVTSKSKSELKVEMES